MLLYYEKAVVIDAGRRVYLFDCRTFLVIVAIISNIGAILL